MNSLAELLEDLQESGKWPDKLSVENVREIVYLAGCPKHYIFGSEGKLDIECLFKKTYVAKGARAGYKGRRYGNGETEQTFKKFCWLIEATENSTSKGYYIAVATCDENGKYEDCSVLELSTFSITWKVICAKRYAARSFKPLFIDISLGCNLESEDAAVECQGYLLQCLNDVKKAYDDCIERLVDSALHWKPKLHMSRIDEIKEVKS